MRLAPRQDMSRNYILPVAGQCFVAGVQPSTPSRAPAYVHTPRKRTFTWPFGNTVSDSLEHMSTIVEDEEPQRPTAQSTDTAPTIPKDDKMDNATHRSNNKTFPEDSAAALVDMQKPIFPEDVNGRRNTLTDDMISLEVVPSTTGYDNPVYDISDDDAQSKSSTHSASLPASEFRPFPPIVIPSRQPCNAGSSTLDILMLVASFSQISVGATVSWSHVLHTQLTNDSTTIFGAKIHLPKSQMNLAYYLLLAGLAVGLALGGWVVSSLGRSRSVVAGAITGVLSWATNALASTVAVVLFGRFFAGFTAALLKVSVIMYVMEISNVSRRGQSLAFLEVMQAAGAALCLALNRWLHWSYVGLVHLGLLALVWICSLFFPESPAYLIMQREDTKARGELQELRDIGADVEGELQYIKHYDTSGKIEPGFLSLIRKPYIHHLMTLVALSVVSVFSGSAIISWNGKDMLLASGPIENREVAIITIVGSLAAGAMILVCFVDRMGRRFCLLLSLMALVLAYSVVGAMDYASALKLNVEPLITAQNSTDTVLVSPNSTVVPFSWVVVRTCFLILAAVSLTSGLATVPNILAVEYFPAYCRPQGLSVVLTITVLVQALSVFLQPMIKGVFTQPGLFWFMGAISLLGIFYVNFCVPEIKSRIFILPDWYQCFCRENFYVPRPLS